jgi:hypothetical protein
MEPQKRRRGRPTVAARPGEKATLGIRASARLKERLEEASKENGRSLSQEAELRLERSFERERGLPELMALKFSPRLAALLILIGETCRRTGIIVDHHTHDALPSVGDEWTDHHHAFDYASMAANLLWKSARPEGEAPQLDSKTRKRVDGLVSQFVNETINDIKHPEKARTLRDAPLLHAFAGSMAERMALPALTKEGDDNAR